LRSDDGEGLLQALGVDFRYLWAPYRGPKLHPEVPGRTIDEWGIHRRWVEHDTGGYWDYTDFPLKDASPGAGRSLAFALILMTIDYSGICVLSASAIVNTAWSPAAPGWVTSSTAPACCAPCSRSCST
jgi:hypothetical protein